jgi:hypothetical protein
VRVRAFRTLAGLVLTLVGFVALLAGVAGAIALNHRDDDGAFTATLAPIHADGYAIEVPDAGATLGHAGVGALFGSGRVRVTVRAINGPVLLALGPSDDVGRYLDGVPRSQLESVGFTRGAAPVTLFALPGERTPTAPSDQTFWTLTGNGALTWSVGPQAQSLVVIRTDHQPGIDATLAVSTYAGWLLPSTVVALLLGVGGVLFGVALLFVASEPVLVVEAHRMVEFADRVAERLGEIAPGESLAVVRRTRGLDLTGELVTVRSQPRNAGSRHDEDAEKGHNARRWRSRGHTPPELADRWGVDESADEAVEGADDDPADSADGGESPYVYTAT